MAVCDPPGVDATPIPEPAPGPPQEPSGDHALYRRRQKRRAIIAWSVAALLVVVVVSAAIIGGSDNRRTTDSASLAGLMPAEMSSSQYEQIHKGQEETTVLQLIGMPGQQEGEIEEPELLQLFPAAPAGSTCDFWRLSDAPDHLVRLCFSPSQVLLQKSVAAQGEDAAPRTLA